jgi:hypothetical protein
MKGHFHSRRHLLRLLWPGNGAAAIVPTKVPAPVSLTARKPVGGAFMSRHLPPAFPSFALRERYQRVLRYTHASCCLVLSFYCNQGEAS